jgi:hypothetical protein
VGLRGLAAQRGGTTFNRLLSEEVIPHLLDLGMQAGNGADHGGEVLHYQPPRHVREVCAKLLGIMTCAASDVNEQYGIVAGVVEAIDEPLLGRVETFLHPCGTAGEVADHLLIEVLVMRWIGGEVVEKVEVGVVCWLEWDVVLIGGEFEVAAYEPGGHVLQGWTDDGWASVRSAVYGIKHSGGTCLTRPSNRCLSLGSKALL